MAELKSRIRIKRGTEDKISNSNDTLPEGSLLYNKTKNTLIVSDGTAIKNLKSLTSEKVSNGGILGDGISSDIFIWLDDQYVFNTSFIDSEARFTSNGVSYNKLEVTANQDIKYYVDTVATTVYSASTNTWANNNYKRIEFQAIGSFDNYKPRVYQGNREVSQIFEEESNKVKNASLADRAINSINADNAIKNADGTYSGFTQDTSGVLQVEEEIIRKKKLLWSGDVRPKDVNSAIILSGIEQGDILEIELNWDTYRTTGGGTQYDVPFGNQFIKFKVPNSVPGYQYSGAYINLVSNNIVTNSFLFSCTLRIPNTLDKLYAQQVSITILRPDDNTISTDVNNDNGNTPRILSIYKIVE